MTDLVLKPHGLKIRSFLTSKKSKSWKGSGSYTPAFSGISRNVALRLESAKHEKEAKKLESENASRNKSVVLKAQWQELVVDRERLAAAKAFHGLHFVRSAKFYDEMVKHLIAEVTARG